MKTTFETLVDSLTGFDLLSAKNLWLSMSPHQRAKEIAIYLTTHGWVFSQPVALEYRDEHYTAQEWR